MANIKGVTVAIHPPVPVSGRTDAAGSHGQDEAAGHRRR